VTTVPARAPTSAFDVARDRLRGQGIYLLLVGVWATTWAIIFLDGGSPGVTALLVRSVGLGIIAAGQTAVIIGGSIDLSVAWLLTVCAMLAASIADGDSAKLPLAIAAALAVGVFVGVVNGVIVTKLRVHGFVATLGTGLILNGVISMTFAENAPASMPRSIVKTLGFGKLGPIPWSVVLLAAVLLLTGWLLTRTRIGTHIYAVGGGDDVARLSGIRADRSLIAAHAFSGFTAAIAGVYLASRLGTPNVEIGTNGVYDLESIAVVVLGGAALAGGKGRVGATFAAVLVFALVDSAFNQLQIDPFLKLVVRGAIIIAAVASYTVRSGEEAQ
jgi:ribose transport system permease protein